jgi:hypothetical protein
MAEMIDVERWPLFSGQWIRTIDTSSWQLEATPNGRAVAYLGFEADIALMLNAPQEEGAAADAYLPPDFSHSPTNGRELARSSASPRATWIPPYGAAPAEPDRKQTREVRGLRQTTVDIAPCAAKSKTLSATDDAPFELPVPQPGEYEFLSARFHTEREVLVAFEVRSSTFFAWFPQAARWQRVDHASGGTLAEITCNGDSWGIETSQRGAVTELFIPTIEGMAVVDIDVVSLTFDVTYHGEGSAIGAPILWANEVRLPVRDAQGGVFLVSATTAPMSLPVPPTVRFAPPVCDGRQLIWCANEGQLVVRKNAAGAPQAQWFEWPAGITVKLAFGCPFLSRDGSFWQLAFNDVDEGHYLYLQLGRQDGEHHRLDSPRFCTGATSFRQTERIKGNPWNEAEHAADVGSDELIVPLLESTRNAAVLSLLIRTTQGVSILESRTERPQAVLQYQADNTADQPFFTPQVTQPWRLRVFVHDARLWVYHPDRERIAGWQVAP